MRNSATSSFDSPEFNIKDFDVLWLDDHLSQLVTPVHPSLLRQRPAMEMWLGQVLVDFVDERGGEVAIQDVRKHLSEVALGDSTALSFAEHEAGSLRNLLYTHPDVMLKEIAQVFFNSPTRPLFPICRTPFPPYVRNEFSFCVQELHFDTHLGSFTGTQEKCVDIALAVDMLHYATVPNAFDVAVLISGDADFLPALVRTRQKARLTPHSLHFSRHPYFPLDTCRFPPPP